MISYTVTNKQTGEVIELTDKELSFNPSGVEVAPIDSIDTVAEFVSGKVPYHISMLMEKAKRRNLLPEHVEYEMDCFVGGPSKPFSEYIGSKVVVLGAAIIPHGPFRAYEDKDKPDAPIRPGYLRCLFMIDEKDKDGNHVILECNGINVFDHTVNMLNIYGWYIWETPREYLIKRGGSRNAYFMRSVLKPPTNKTKVVESK